MSRVEFEQTLRTKVDVLTEGVRMTPDLDGLKDFQPHIMAIYDDNASSNQSLIHNGKMPFPEVLTLPLDESVGGYDTMVVKTRINNNSLWRLSESGDKLILRGNDDAIEVGVLEKPAFYGINIGADGKPILVEQVVQRLGPDLIATMLSNLCVYQTMSGVAFGIEDGMGCRFCELQPTFKKSGIYPRVTKPTTQIAESAHFATQRDANLKYLIINAGTWLGDRKNGPDYDQIIREYIKLVQQIRQQGDKFHIYSLCIPPRDFQLIKDLSEAGGGPEGITMVFGLEVLDDDLAKSTTPGKYLHYGRSNFWQAFDYSQQHGIKAQTQLVYGFQSWNPSEPDEPFNGQREADAVVKAAEFLTDKGIMPLISIYHYSPQSRIGRIPFTPNDVWSAHSGFAEVVVGSLLYKTQYNDTTFGSRVSLPNTLEQDFIFLEKMKQQDSRHGL